MRDPTTEGAPAYAEWLDELRAAEAWVHIAGAGAGNSLHRGLWGTPGASAALVGATFPHSRHEFAAFVGFDEERHVSAEAAIDLAAASYLRASEHVVLSGGVGRPVGVGITAALASTREPRRGYQAHVCVLTRSGSRSLAVELPAAEQDATAHRLAQDEVIARATVALVGASLDAARPSPPGCAASDALADERLFARPVFGWDGRREAASARGLYLAASLNPPHEGHEGLLHAAELACGGRMRGRYLLTTTAVHKPPLGVAEVLDRVALVAARRRVPGALGFDVEVSRGDPLFVDKARARPGSTFLLGADAMARMFDPAWGVPVAPLLDQLAAAEATFLVMGRKVGDTFVRREDIAVPEAHAARFIALEGRFDVSSTELRARSENRSTVAPVPPTRGT